MGNLSIREVPPVKRRRALSDSALMGGQVSLNRSLGDSDEDLLPDVGQVSNVVQIEHRVSNPAIGVGDTVGFPK